MANLRVFKKDVIFLVNEVISDCWVYMYFHSDKNLDEAKKITSFLNTLKFAISIKF